MDYSIYKAAEDRYESGMAYIRCGQSGILLPAVSLGLWHNFGSVDDFDNALAIARYAFDNGITCFDLANNYGPLYGTAEENFGRIMDNSFRPYRDELFITTRRDMTCGPVLTATGVQGNISLAALIRALKGCGLNMLTSSIRTDMTLSLRWMRLCRLWSIRYAAARPFMWEYPTILLIPGICLQLPEEPRYTLFNISGSVQYVGSQC